MNNKVISVTAAILLVVFSVAYTQEAPGDSKTRTIFEWVALIKKDPKLKTLISMLGKPDTNTGHGNLLAMQWFNKVDDGTKTGTSLAIGVREIKGEMTVVTVHDMTTDTNINMPWFDYY